MQPLQIFKALADETRLSCIMLLQQAVELCVCDLVDSLGLSQPKVSRHLALLKQAGLLLDRRQGQWVYYRINPDLPGWASNMLARLADESPLAAIKTQKCC
jgi:ArsR family transcriptional regulator, arsenate/arsenite/antimonite-responsive transcriptional repressor